MKPNLNPIAKKLNLIVKNTSLSKELMCVKLNVCFPTFNNIFSRNRVSKRLLLALEMTSIITRKDINEYKIWCKKQKRIKSKSETTVENN